MARVRRLDELPLVAKDMRSAAVRSEEKVVNASARAVSSALNAQGRRYELRGARGDKVSLSVSRDTKVFRRKDGRQGATAVVRAGRLAGFWRIVQDGSEKHLIVGKYRAGFGPRKRRGRGRSTNLRRLESGAAFNDTNAVAMPGVTRAGKRGPAYSQFVVHPGHGRIGDPWGRGMRVGKDAVRKIHRDIAEQEFKDSWFGKNQSKIVRSF